MNTEAKELLEKFKKCTEDLYERVYIKHEKVSFDEAFALAEKLNSLLGDNAWYKELPKPEEALKQAKEGNIDALGFVAGWIPLVESQL
jgi:hypothetical protein